LGIGADQPGITSHIPTEQALAAIQAALIPATRASQTTSERSALVNGPVPWCADDLPYQVQEDGTLVATLQTKLSSEVPEVAPVRATHPRDTSRVRVRQTSRIRVRPVQARLIAELSPEVSEVGSHRGERKKVCSGVARLIAQ